MPTTTGIPPKGSRFQVPIVALVMHIWYTNEAPKKGANMSTLAKGKTRVQLTFSEKLLGRMDDYCERTGISRSAFVSTCIAQQLDTHERVLDVTNGVLQQAIESLQQASTTGGDN